MENLDYGQLNLVKQELLKLKSSIEKLLERIKEKIADIESFSFIQYMEQVKSSEQSQQFEDIVNKMNVVCQIDENQIKKIEDEQFELIQFVQIKDIKRMKAQILQFNQKIAKVVTQLIELPNMNIFDWQFSETYRNSNFNVEGLQVTKKTVSNRALIYTEQGFYPEKQSISFEVRVEKATSRYFIGVGERDKWKQSGFKITPEECKVVGHGLYMNCFDGIILHDRDKEINHSVSGIKYQTGDSILVQYISKRQILKFLNLRTDESYDLNIPPIDIELYPCLLIYNTSDKAILVKQ